MPPGRKTKLTDELCEALVIEFEKGKTNEGACGAVGLGLRTFYEWMEKAEKAKGTTKFTKFRDKITLAKHKGQSVLEDILWEDMVENKNINTIKWYLPRRDRANYGNDDSSQSNNDLEELVDPSEEDKIFSGVEYE